jgi:hypothetical protein
MQPVDLVARAEIAQLKVRLHQMTTALFMAINALDMALKASERMAAAVSREPDRPGAQGGDADVLRQARAQILNMRMLLR